MIELNRFSAKFPEFATFAAIIAELTASFVGSSVVVVPVVVDAVQFGPVHFDPVQADATVTDRPMMHNSTSASVIDFIISSLFYR